MNLSKLFENNGNFPLRDSASARKLLYKKQIFNILYLENRKSIADLCNTVSVSVPTMTRIMHELMDEGWVKELGTGKSRGGRRPVFFGLNPDVRYILGIELTKKYTRINIFDMHNRAIGETYQIDIELQNPGLFEVLREQTELFIRNSNIDKKRILGAGLSLPGLIDKKTDVNFTYPNLGGKPLHETFTDLLKVPAYVEHDTKAMALGESWFGLAKNKSNVLCLNVGSGIGLGMILNGELYHGFSGFSGEFGHIQLDPEGALCDCGKIGCLETLASGSALVAKAKQKIGTGTNSIITKLVNDRTDEIKLPVIINAAHQGDQFAIELIEEAGGYLARGISTLLHLLNPELVIIGGDMARAENLLADPIQQKLNKYTIGRIRQDTRIFISELKDQAGLLGTIPVVMLNVFSQEPGTNNNHKSIKT